MAKLESQASFCMSCYHVKFCQVNWGSDCKRQGGKKIPRMKFIAVKEKPTIPETVSKNKEKPEEKINKIFDPIKTKVVCW